MRRIKRESSVEGIENEKKTHQQKEGFFFFLKTIYRDILLLYRNFFHWNVSKILITISSFLFALFLSLPFFLILAVIMYFDPIDWRDMLKNIASNQIFALSTAYQNIGIIILESIFIVTIAAIIFFVYAFVPFLRMKLAYSYLQ
jgi:hypothetical protein